MREIGFESRRVHHQFIKYVIMKTIIWILFTTSIGYVIGYEHLTDVSTGLTTLIGLGTRLITALIVHVPAAGLDVLAELVDATT